MNTRTLGKSIGNALSRIPQGAHVRRVLLFGSRLHGTSRAASDVDLLIELQRPVGYFDLVRIQRAIEKEAGTRIDLVTPQALSRYFRTRILRTARPVYEKR